ncbi:MAG: hypothetical protein RL564_1493, partial [Pseudomonadota bacterium]
MKTCLSMLVVCLAFTVSSAQAATE